MNDTEFDRALVASAFSLAAERGWKSVSVTVAARAAGLALDRARGRFSGRDAILARFGRIADQAALAQATATGDNRDRLFDLVMRRIDVLQAHRAGILALREYLPGRPGLSLMLALATAGSMAWLLEGAGVPASGLRGSLRVNGMVAVWLYTLRAWRSDESEDLSATMAALDKALDRAVQAETWARMDSSDAAAEPVMPDVAAPASEIDAMQMGAAAEMRAAEMDVADLDAAEMGAVEPDPPIELEPPILPVPPAADPPSSPPI